MTYSKTKLIRDYIANLSYYEKHVQVIGTLISIIKKNYTMMKRIYTKRLVHDHF